MNMEKTQSAKKTVIRRLIGLGEIALAILIIYLGFLRFVFAYLFGCLFFLVSLFLLIDGVNALIVRKKIKIISLTGAILVFLGIVILISSPNKLELTNFFSNYQNTVSLGNQNLSFSFEFIFQNLYGGFVGEFLAALLNTVFGNLATIIIGSILSFIGFVLLILNAFIDIYKNYKTIDFDKIKSRKKKSDVETKDDSSLNEKKIIETEEKEKVKDLNLTNFENEIEAYAPKKKTINEPILNDSKVNNEDTQTIIKPYTQDYFEEVEQDIKSNESLKNDNIVSSSSQDDNSLYSSRKVAQNSYTFTDSDQKDVFDKIEEENVIRSKERQEKNQRRYVDTFKDDKFSSFFQNKEKENVQEQAEEDYSSLPYVFPSLDLLKDRQVTTNLADKIQTADERAKKINECFRDFHIGAMVVSYTIGPSVTRFDVKLNSNVKTSVLNNLETDLGVRLEGNKTVRIETIVEGKDTCGIEVGNKVSDIVSFKDCMRALESNTKDRLLFPVGKDISGNVIIGKLDDMPHLLIAGTTNSGKSIFIHNIIMSLIMRNKPDELKLMLLDPKKVEFVKYNELPHLLCPIVTTTEQGKIALKTLVQEMEDRFDMFALRGEGATSYKEYLEVCEERGYKKIPYIVLIIDEFADFMAEGDKETAKYIQRIAQKARACGLYMIIATQRPSAKVITGEIKANIPSRVALSVSQALESRIIIDEDGAENLVGKGDLLAKLPTSKSLIRAQSAFVDSKEIYQVVQHIKKYAKVQYDPKFNLDIKTPSTVTLTNDNRSFRDDELYEQVKTYVLETGKCSSTKIQNAFKIGFPRADGILEALEEDGIIKKENNHRVLADEYRLDYDDFDDDEE